MITPASKDYKGDRKEYPKNYRQTKVKNKGCRKPTQFRESERRRIQIANGQLKVENGLVFNEH
jgi:hypothetical protein